MKDFCLKVKTLFAAAMIVSAVDNPTRVSPKTEEFGFSGTGLTRACPGNSFTVLRPKTRE
jgi:hypothetical protein